MRIWNEKTMKTIWFTSDQHFWHSNIIRYCNRPFKDVIEMNETIIQNYNSLVSATDIVYFLGDFSFGGSNLRKTTLDRLKGCKIIIRGNHDPSLNKLLSLGFDESYDYYHLVVNDFNLKLFLYHYPYPEIYNSENDWQLCGHIHKKWKVKNKVINVGVDVWDFKPISLPEIAREINEKTKQ